MEENNLKAAVEALIFASEKPITLPQIKAVLEIPDNASINKIIEELKNEYVVQNRGIRVTEVAGGFQMITNNTFAPFLKKLFKNRYSDKLSKQALETLAIIAYKQPLTKPEVVSLRTVNIDGVMKSLLDKNLIRICGRKKVTGRPYVFGTTREFLEHFGLKSLQDLPKIEDFTALAQQELLSQDVEPITQANLEVRNEPKQIA